MTMAGLMSTSSTGQSLLLLMVSTGRSPSFRTLTLSALSSHQYAPASLDLGRLRRLPTPFSFVVIYLLRICLLSSSTSLLSLSTISLCGTSIPPRIHTRMTVSTTHTARRTGRSWALSHIASRYFLALCLLDRRLPTPFSFVVIYVLRMYDLSCDDFIATASTDARMLDMYSRFDDTHTLDEFLGNCHQRYDCGYAAGTLNDVELDLDDVEYIYELITGVSGYFTPRIPDWLSS